jgi:hypothetical protein
MNNLEVRQQVKSYIDQLSAEKLLVAADFLAYLVEKEDNEATEELLKLDGLKEAFAEAQNNVKQGKMISVEQLKRKY